MENTLKLVGKNSNEIFTLRYPSTLLNFCEFDFSYYAGEAIEVCNEALKTGTPDFDKISEIKKEIQSAHCFLQYSTRTAYDKVVYDCWIDYVCRRDNIGNNALWNRFIRCKTPFEKIIFQRLCDFRYKRAVNEWLNIIRVQDYAKSKVAFVFANGMKSSREAEERRSYFDLMFSVTAREMGCRLEELGVTKYYSICRTPGSPFLFPNISKEIIRHMLAGFDYSDDYSDIDDYTESSDEIAMDAFSRMKAGLPSDLSAYNIPAGKMENLSDRIYMPCGLKAAIDLEIDVTIESGMWLAKCKRCGRYFIKSKENSEDYCRRRNVPSGKTCLEIYEEEHPRPKMTEALLERCRTVTDEMYSRVEKTISAAEYNSWYNYLEAMKQKVDNGEISPSELESFLEYSLEVDISKSNPILEVAKKEPEVHRERVVKPFVPERISRSDIKQYNSSAEGEEFAEPAAKPLREGFFTSPSVQRQKNERPQISHIIRNGEPLGGERVSAPDPSGFQPFEAQYRTSPIPQSPEPPISAQPEVKPRPAKREERDPYENLKRLEERLESERRLREERNAFKPPVEAERGGFVEDYPRTAHREQPRAEYEEPRRQPNREPEQTVYGYGENAPYAAVGNKKPAEPKPIQRIMRSGEYSEETVQNFGSQFERQTASSDRREEYKQPEDYPTRQPEQPGDYPQPAQQPEPPKPRVIKKNAAAISAYGKMAGKAVSTISPADIRQPAAEQQPAYQSRSDDGYEQPVRDDYSQPVHNAAPQIDNEILEPFKDIGSIFDVLEQSNGGAPRRRPQYDDEYNDNPRRNESRYSDEQPYEKNANTQRFVPDYPEQSSEQRQIRNDEAPGGFWTEDRGLFQKGTMPTADTQSSAASGSEELYETEEQSSEPPAETPKGGRHSKSRKTQRLYDLIMREPDDNPNFRNKK